MKLHRIIAICLLACLLSGCAMIGLLSDMAADDESSKPESSKSESSGKGEGCGMQLLESVRSHIGAGKRYLADLTMREDLRVFFIRRLDGLFYTNERSAIIFLDHLDIRRFHALQMMIPRYLPTLFESSPLSDEETALLKSLGSRASGEYERLIEQFARRLDMRGEMIRTRLRGFEKSFERERAHQIEEVIARFERDYKSMLEDLRRTANAIQDQQIILAGLRCRMDGEEQGESELMEYFLCNKSLSIIRVAGTELEFVAHGYADVFDEDAFDAYARNHGSALYRSLRSDISKDSMERLYRAIFESGIYKLRVCAAYRADMRNSLTPIREYNFPPESRDYLPNPHIQRYGCIGGYATRFAEYMYNRDYVGAIDQAAVSARNLNFHDSTVMETLAHTLSHTAIRCIEDTTGTLMTPRQAIKKLEEEVAACPNQSELPMR
ncbi:hypothetical protein LJC63_11240 [Ruminococcaceae bacterium OttesenSCG-928-L11]|nr:hypothetical protein [Ruminococcaceae bacterium OttesenSCG-928-L11]